MRLKDKRILIIGVSEGLGYALAYFLLKEGAEVIITARNAQKLEKIKKSLESLGKINYISSEIKDINSAKELIKNAYSMFNSKIDGLCILIGGYIEDDIYNLKGLDEMINNHIKYPLYIISAGLEYLNEGSTIVLISALRGIDKALPNQLSYSIGKAGIAKAVEVLASELLDKGIRVVGIAPSWIYGNFEPGRDWKSERKLGDPKAPPEDFARVITWLMTDEAEWVNGTVIPVDGGSRLR
ncbi:SDR family oxidoreductase [Acidianus sulfidivorans JP7]|uniref:Short chain dehydrogenase n=1 Tax=Acidianus sulfidivorans JP7 TaxID=619593 RepID=A0A2U9IKD9_9CREN|nr:SDR family NAD(P)-dependent oxidoreductase [Acidianus sulfidivorans]AWR96480.1 SDR family oxidoreductase [Acidianus sulfidivorans JP7]